jgi:hypothetical protein
VAVGYSGTLCTCEWRSGIVERYVHVSGGRV